MTRRSAIITALTLLVAFAAACGPRGAKEIKSGTVGRLTVTFKDSSGKTVDVGSASLNFYMPPMGAMAAMNSAATLKTTSTPGVYQGKAKIEMPGEWQAQIAYEGPAGSGKGSFPVTAQ